jgi:hypothetical protein
LRAQRRAAIAELLRAMGQATDKELAAEANLPLSAVRELRREMVEDGEVEAVPSAPGSHYPIAGWRMAP